MLEKYNTTNLLDKKNAIKEIIQEIVLCGLSRAGFFDKAVFYGKTTLRIFYGLDRFSEDLDFSLRTKELLNNKFDSIDYEEAKKMLFLLLKMWVFLMFGVRNSLKP